MSKAEQILNQILQDQKVRDENGLEQPLHSGIRQREGAFLRSIIEGNKLKRGIEIGCAYGISSLYICSALEGRADVSHTIVDPFQRDWRNIGVLNLKRAGIHFFEIIEEKSELALPMLLREGKRFDFAFIDGWHTFDQVLVDFFFINRMMDVGGVIAFHDVDMPSIKKLLRYILKYPAYQFLGSATGVTYPLSAKRRFYESIVLEPISRLAQIMPASYANDMFSSTLTSPSRKLGLEATLVAIKKVREDERDWRWFEQF